MLGCGLITQLVVGSYCYAANWSLGTYHDVIRAGGEDGIRSGLSNLKTVKWHNMISYRIM